MRAMTTETKADELEQMFAAHWRCERAIAAGRRYISPNSNAAVSQTDIREFLRRRRDRLSEAEVEYCSKQAMQRWLKSPANRWTVRRNGR
jgi:hypothetical protein